MGTRGSAEALIRQLDEVRDRAADMLADDGGMRKSSGWPARVLWLGVGVGVGAAAASGRLLTMLPAQLASRLEDAVGKVTSAAGGLTGGIGAFGSSAGGRLEEIPSPGEATSQATEGASDDPVQG
jgi:hypothetical protein